MIWKNNKIYKGDKKMIPDIGVMVGMYIIARCANMIGKKETVALSWITIVVTVLMVLDLIGKGTK